MSHPLLTKKALDAVNEELLAPTRDPRADAAEYNSPFQARGTEFSPTKMGRKPVGVDYLAMAEHLAEQLAELSDLAPKGSHVRVKAWAASHDLRRGAATDREAGTYGTPKRSDVEQHRSPKVLPPRNDARRHMDEDLKKELEKDKD